MKAEIEVDIPQHLLDSYDVVAFRRANRGESGMVSGIVCQFYEDTSEPYLILRPKAQWPEWPEWLTADWAVRDRDDAWVYGNGEPPKPEGDWWEWGDSDFVSPHVISLFFNITPPTYDGPWQHSLIRNPWKGGE